MPAFFLPIVLLIICTAIVQARVIHVPGDSTTIQGGINGAVNGDTVMVHPGTYYEYDIDFLGKAITVMSTDPEDSATVASTVVDGDSLGSVFYFHSGEDSNSVLAGLLITGGFANNGGGIYCADSSSPSICYNIFSGNTAGIEVREGGGAIACDASSPIISYNIITGNWALWTGGGIMCTNNASPSIVDNVIKDNSTDWYGGAVWCDWYTFPTITGNVIKGNTAGYSGGGVNCDQYAHPLVANNIISENWAGEWGGGVDMYSNSYATIVNNIITGNWAERSGGGIDCRYLNVHPLIANNTVVGNAAGESGGGMRCANDAFPTIKNNVFWDNDAPSSPEIYYYGSEPSVTFCDVRGSWPGEGNIDIDPLFMAPDSADYHLQEASPCIDTGDPSILDACRPPGLGEERSDMGAYGGEENCGWPPSNHAPMILSSPDTIAVAGLEYFYDVEAEDADGDTLHYSLQVAPHWLSIDSVTGVIRGIPPLEAVGDTTVTIVVEDSLGGSDDQVFPLIVLPTVDIIMTPDGPTTVMRGEILYFNTYIENNKANSVEGDLWLSVVLPASAEFLIPEGLLNYSNPLHGQIFGYGFTDLNNQLFIPTRADTGSYQLIGRVGVYPNTVIDEESFGFQVIE
jgi:hypothetical protein